MKRVKHIALLALLVIVVAAACGGGGTVIRPAGVTPQAEEHPGLGGTSGGTEQLTSYKTRYAIHFTGTDAQGQVVDKYWENVQEFTREPRAQRTVTTTTESSQGQAAQTTVQESITIGLTTYAINQWPGREPTCVFYTEETEPPLYVRLEDTSPGGMTYVNTEIVSGLRAKHYTLTDASLPYFGFASGKGDVWLAEDGGFLVREVIQGTGAGFLVVSGDHQGTTQIEYDLTDVNGSFQIVAPQGCTGV